MAAHEAGSASAQPELSVLMPCRNAESFLAEQLEALSVQDFAGPWELVFIDNGSTDRSVAIAEKFRDRLPLVFVSAPEQPGRCYALNCGLGAARSENIVTIDADDLVDETYLSTFHAALSEHDFVTCGIDETRLNPAWSVFAYDVPPTAYGRFPPAAFGGVIGVKRHVLDAVGGHPEHLRYGADLILSLRINASGTPLFVIDERLLHYRHRRTLGAVFRQHMRWGYSQAFIYREVAGHAAMQRNSLSEALREWGVALRMCLMGPGKPGRAHGLVRLGYAVGRARGSLRARVWYP